MLRGSNIGFGFYVRNRNIKHLKALRALVSAHRLRNIPSSVSKETKYRDHIASVERGKACADIAS